MFLSLPKTYTPVLLISNFNLFLFSRQLWATCSLPPFCLLSVKTPQQLPYTLSKKRDGWVDESSQKGRQKVDSHISSLNICATSGHSSEAGVTGEFLEFFWNFGSFTEELQNFLNNRLRCVEPHLHIFSSVSSKTFSFTFLAELQLSLSLSNLMNAAPPPYSTLYGQIPKSF